MLVKFEQIRMIQTSQNIIFQCSKNNCSPTRVTAVAYPGGCIECACTPGSLRGAPKRRGEKERSKESERQKGQKRGAKEGEKGRERKYAKEKEKREEIKRK